MVSSGRCQGNSHSQRSREDTGFSSSNRPRLQGPELRVANKFLPRAWRERLNQLLSEQGVHTDSCIDVVSNWRRKRKIR